MGVPEGVPEGRCGFTLEPEDLPTVESEEVRDASKEGFWRVRGIACCYRRVWNRRNRCIWHADTERKPVGELVAAKSDNSERLDGAILDGVDLEDSLSFEGDRLVGARLSDADLWEVDLFGADLRWADLSNTALKGANLSVATLRGANLSDAYLSAADLSDADFFHTNLLGANLSYANLSQAFVVEADVSDAYLLGANLSDAIFKSTDLSNTTLINATLTNAELLWTDLSSTDFHGADLSGAELSMKSIESVDFRSATLSQTNFEGLEFDGVDLRGADLTEVKLHNAHFQDIRIDDDTKFGDEDRGYRSTYELDADETATTGSISGDTDDNDESEDGDIDDDASAGILPNPLRRWLFWVRANRNSNGDPVKNLENAIWTYRTYQRLLREHALPDKVPRYYVREKHTRRKLALAENNYLEWLKLSLARWTMLYGESAWRVVGTSVVIIAIWTVLYLFAGGIEETVNTPNSVTHDIALPFGPLINSPPELATTIFANLYFSVVTFTTLGYGDVQPASGAVQLLAGIQSLLGASLIALLVAVLSRRVMR